VRARPERRATRALVVRPTRQDLEAARGRRVPDLIAPKLAVLFCGINPSLYSAAVGHHFARPGNRFWHALHRAGFSERLLAPAEELELLRAGYGITNLVGRATASAAELDPAEYPAGARVLARKVRKYQPEKIAFVGIDAYRRALNERAATIGEQARRFAGARTWVLPNPSGLNAHYQLPELAALYRSVLES
jgi:TDG/mug DNA glycosylase family protein